MQCIVKDYLEENGIIAAVATFIVGFVYKLNI